MATKNYNILQDRLLLAGFAGFIAAIGANLSLFLINQFIPGQNVNMPQVTIEIFLNHEAYQHLIVRIMGVLWSTVIGGIYALLYVVALDLTGWNNLWLKALIIVNGTWLLLAGFTMNILNLNVYTRDEPMSIVAFYFAHMLFATYLYGLIYKFGQQNRPHEDAEHKTSTQFRVAPVKKLMYRGKNNRFVKAIKPKKIR